MIEIIRDLPANVVGIIAKGRITNEERDKILRPAIKKSLRRHVRVRLYYEFSCRFPGAGWPDLELEFDRQPQWERVAVITDIGWLRQTVNALRFLIAGEVRVFASIQAREGRAWIVSPLTASWFAPTVACADRDTRAAADHRHRRAAQP